MPLQRHWYVKFSALLSWPDKSYKVLHHEPPDVLLCARPTCQALLSAGAPDSVPDK